MEWQAGAVINRTRIVVKTQSTFARAASTALFVAAVSVGNALLAENHFVAMTFSLTFNPYYLEIQAGDTVTWVNHDSFDEHDATSDTGTWSTGVVGPDESSSPIPFNTPGIYSYHDSLYGLYGMVGSVVVNAAPTPLPQAALTDALLLPEGGFLFTITNLTAGKETVVGTSTNLSVWTPVWTNVPAGDSLSFTNTPAPGVANQFFRCWQIP